VTVSGDRLSDWHDRLSGSDPGAVRFLTALRATLGLLAVIGAEYALIHLTGALEVSVGPGVTRAQAATQHHQMLVIAMLLAGTLALVTGFGITDATARQQFLSLLVAPVFVLVALTIGLSIGGHRGWALTSFPVLLAFGGYCRRYGPRGFISGVLLFIGDFIGFLLHGTLQVGDIGWLAAEVGVAVIALMVVRFVLFYPDTARAVRRLQRSYLARAARLADLAIDVVDGPTPRARRRLARQLVRLNEVALLIDAQLDRGAGRLHQRLFDMELALTNLARFAEAMAIGDILTPALRDPVRRALVGIRSGDLIAAQRAAADLTAHLRTTPPPPADRVIPHRFATTLAVYAEATGDWLALGRDAGGPPAREREGDAAIPGVGPPAREEDTAAPAFTSVVQLRSGWLPGSALVSADAATAGQAGGRRRVRLPMNIRSAIQMSIAVAAAVAAGDAISPQRFYWAVLAAFLAFVGTNHVAEQVRKAVYRVLGTVVGIILGSALVRVVGHHTVVSVVLILVALFFGVYLFRISYAFMVIAITIAISQVYVQLDEYSTSLLLTRLAETAVGSAIALVVIALVFPLRTRDVFGLAVTQETPCAIWPPMPPTAWPSPATSRRCAPTPGSSTPPTRPWSAPPLRCAGRSWATSTAASGPPWPPPLRPGTTGGTWWPTSRPRVRWVTRPRPPCGPPPPRWTTRWPASSRSAGADRAAPTCARPPCSTRSTGPSRTSPGVTPAGWCCAT
jgi:hypothetical protein